MSNSGHPSQYQSAPPPNYQQGYQPPPGAQAGQYGAYTPQPGHGAPPPGYHAAPAPGYQGAPAPGYQGAPAPGYQGAPATYQGAPPPGYHVAPPPGHHGAAPPVAAPAPGHHGAAPPVATPPPGYQGAAAPATYHGAAPPSYGQPPAGYSQHPHSGTQHGAHPPPAANPYATSHTGAPTPGHAPAPPTDPASPPGVDPTLWQVFRVVDANSSNSITAIELQQALTNNNWTQFNGETCRLLIGQFDQNKDGSIDIYEFSHLWKYIQDWRQCFEGFDTDKSGTIDVNELQQAFQTFGYRLSVEFCRLCTRVFDRSDKHSMNFDSFIQCCVLMRSLTDAFKKRDTNMNGLIDVSYEDFLEMVIDNTVSN